MESVSVHVRWGERNPGQPHPRPHAGELSWASHGLDDINRTIGSIFALLYMVRISL